MYSTGTLEGNSHQMRQSIQHSFIVKEVRSERITYSKVFSLFDLGFDPSSIFLVRVWIFSSMIVKRHTQSFQWALANRNVWVFLIARGHLLHYQSESNSDSIYIEMIRWRSYPMAGLRLSEIKGSRHLLLVHAESECTVTFVGRS